MAGACRQAAPGVHALPPHPSVGVLERQHVLQGLADCVVGPHNGQALGRLVEQHHQAVGIRDYQTVRLVVLRQRAGCGSGFVHDREGPPAADVFLRADLEALLVAVFREL